MSNEEVWNSTNVKEKLIEHLKSKTDYDFKGLLGEDTSKWELKELIEGVGNLNYIYFVVGEKNSLVIKWAPPYVRVGKPFLSN
jgi:5-methylthioribose kinase